MIVVGFILANGVDEGDGVDESVLSEVEVYGDDGVAAVGGGEIMRECSCCGQRVSVVEQRVAKEE